MAAFMIPGQFQTASGPTTLAGLLFLVAALLILWVIISIPVYFAG